MLLVQAPHAPEVVGQAGLIVDKAVAQHFFDNLKNQSETAYIPRVT